MTRCPNIDCPAQLKNNLRHLASRGALDIEGLGEKLVDQLVETGLVKRLSDLFAVERDALLSLERLGEKSADNLLAGLGKARQTTLARFLIALGIPQVGEDRGGPAGPTFRRSRPIAGGEPGGARSHRRRRPDHRRSRDALLRRRAQRQRGGPAAEPRTALAEDGAAALTGKGELAGKTFVLTGSLSAI